MAKTSAGLVAHAEKALKEGWYYLWGAYAQKATQAVIDSNIRQYTDNERWRKYVTPAIGKTRVCDCYGLVKSYLWWVDDSNNPKYNSTYDRNTAGAYNAAKEKDSLSTMPEVAGIILYMTGHVGVYVGNGRFIECMGGGVGMFEGRITNGVITKGSKFTHWFKDTYIDYSAVTVPKSQPKSTGVMLAIDGKAIHIDAENVNGSWRAKVRDVLEAAGYNVGWDETKKTITAMK